MARRTSPLVFLPILALIVAATAAAAAGIALRGNHLARYYEQQLTWSTCDGGRCTTVDVPTDYAHPDDGTVRLSVRVIPATSGDGQSLFINPGGPGASVVGGFDDYMADALGEDVRKRYDIVAVDPRGVGQSDPIECVSDRDMYRLSAFDQTPDDQTERREFAKMWDRFGAGCRAKSGTLAVHMSTEETARDFDIVRAALGSDSFNWFGFSYGSRLGATYATLFPERVGRMVLDGAEDPSAEIVEWTEAQSNGYDVALRAFLDDCATRQSCPFSGEQSESIRKIAALLASLDSQPLKTDDAERPLTEGLAYWGLIWPLYAEEAWPDLSDALAAAFEVDGTPLRTLADDYLWRQPDGSFGDNIGEVFPLLTCTDWKDRVQPADTPSYAQRFGKTSPIFGPAWAWGMIWCAGVPTSEHSQVAINADGSAPIVVIGTTRDPATPFEQSIALVKQLGSAVHVTLEGDGHGAYDTGSNCIDSLVDDYLAHGKVPKDGTVCDG